MKALLTLLLIATINVVSAQSCTITASVTCNRNATAEISASTASNQNWVCQMTGPNGLVVNQSVNQDGRTFTFDNAIILNDSAQYAFTLFDAVAGSLGCGYSTYINCSLPGRTVTGCTGSTTCIITDNPCSPVAPTATPTTTTKKKGKR